VKAIQEESADAEKDGDPLNSCLDGLTIVVSGVFIGITRDEIENLVTKFGGRKTGSISGKTDYLIIGHKLEDGREVTQGGKYRKAKEKGVPVLTEDEFEQYIRDKSGQ